MAQTQNTGLSYRDAGVDIDAGDALVERIKPLAARTKRPGLLSGIGGFGGLFQIPAGYREPVLVSGTDGVGTKLKLAFTLGVHDTIGIDLVAMSVNDILVQGAEPLFFLDYFACGHLDVDVAAAVVAGVATGCEQSGCALLGGETAEMPGMYPSGEYDVAGFAVGVVERSQIIDGSRVQAGDRLLGLASSGPHSNGYSLVRKVIERALGEVSLKALQQPLDGRPLSEHVMAPTRIYVKSLLPLLRSAAQPGPHHRWRAGGQCAPHAARRPGGADGFIPLDASGRVRLAAAAGRYRSGRDAPGVQLRHRHGAGRGTGRCGSRHEGAHRRGRTGVRDRRGGAAPARRGGCRGGLSCGVRSVVIRWRLTETPRLPARAAGVTLPAGHRAQGTGHGHGPVPC